MLGRIGYNKIKLNKKDLRYILAGRGRGNVPRRGHECARHHTGLGRARAARTRRAPIADCGLISKSLTTSPEPCLTFAGWRRRGSAWRGWRPIRGLTFAGWRRRGSAWRGRFGAFDIIYVEFDHVAPSKSKLGLLVQPSTNMRMLVPTTTGWYLDVENARSPATLLALRPSHQAQAK